MTRWCLLALLAACRMRGDGEPPPVDGAAAPSTLAFTGNGGVLWRADGRAVLLGNPTDAKSLLVCRRGALSFASLDGCEGRVALARPLPLQTSTRP